MFCGNCGKENADGVKFCMNCGKPLVDQSEKVEKAEAGVSTETKASGSNAGANKILDKIKSLPKQVLIGICCAIVALVVIICVVINANSTINLNDYITIEVTGYDGYGRATVEIDWDAIEKKYGDKISYTSKAKKEYGGLLSLMTPMEALEDSVSVSLDPRNKLSNGDEISYTWEIDEELFDCLDCKVKYENDTYTVSKLEKVEKIDAFADVSIIFEGIAPNGTATINYKGSDFGVSVFNCDKQSGLRNGDSIVVSIDENQIEYMAENSGKIPKKLEKTYTVEGLDEYVESYSDLTDDFISTLKSESEDTIYSYTASSYSDSSKMSDLTYAGYIVLSVIDGSSYYSEYNSVYMIYRASVSNTEGDFDTTDVYFPVKFSNVLLSDGSISYDENNGIVGYTSLGNAWGYSTKGYTNPLTCYMEIVEGNSDSYSAECGDGFEKYGDYEMVSKLDDISEDEKNALNEDAKSQINSYIESSYNGGSSASDLTVVGEYMLVAKDTMSSYSDNNVYIVVYSATVSNSDGKFEPTTVYFPVEYHGVVKMGSGEYIILSSKGIQGSSSFPDSYYNTKGYIDGITMYEKLVSANRDQYTYEVSEGLRGFGK